jgi:pSer/pThr/pTyr-binding forkhead associated (FHA) protein
MNRPRLVAINPSGRRTRELALSRSELTVGSEKGNSLLIRHDGVSRRHAVIRYRDGRYLIRDLQSTNGTFVNDKRIRDTAALKDGDHVRFGNARFVFLDPRPATSRATRRRLSVARIAELFVLLFVAGFALTEYLLHRRIETAAVPGIARGPRAQPSVALPEGTPLSRARPRATPVSAPNATPAGGPRSEAVGPQPDWLRRINYYRAMAKLPPAREDRSLSNGDLKHTRYLAENYADVIKTGGTLGASGHEESPDKRDYTPEGAAAAQTSNVAWGCGPFSPAGEIDRWVEGPFHRLAILNPELDLAGYGDFKKDGCWTAAVRLPLRPKPPEDFDHPIEFPADGAQVSLAWEGGEWPDPLASCPGYREPIGLPITLEVGRFLDPQLSAHSIVADGQPIEHCAFDAPGYVNSDAFAQEYGRGVLKAFSTIVLIPRRPLARGKTYQVSVTARGREYMWSFKVGASDRDSDESE